MSFIQFPFILCTKSETFTPCWYRWGRDLKWPAVVGRCFPRPNSRYGESLDELKIRFPERKFCVIVILIQRDFALKEMKG